MAFVEKVVGGSDGTVIGNIGDRLKTDVASSDGAVVSLGAQADAAATSDTGTFSLIALFKRLLQGITTFIANQTNGTQVVAQGNGGNSPWKFRGTASDIFDSLITAGRFNQVEVDFSITPPVSITDITVTAVNGATSSNATGHAKFESGTGATGDIRAVSVITVNYHPSYEIYAAFTTAYTTGVAGSLQRHGLYTSTDGFYFGYEGTQFGVSSRFNSVDTHVPQSSWNLDTLTGAANSRFTRNGVPEALDPTKSNLYRIRFGWFGSAPCLFEVFSPDGEWISVHVLRYPNSQLNPSLTTTILPITLHINKTSGSSDIVMYTGCWAAGTTLPTQPSFENAKTTQIVVGTTAVQLDPIPLTGRTAVEVLFPRSTAHTQGGNVDGVAWVGWTSGVTSVSGGRELQPGESWRFDVSPATRVYAITNNASQIVTLSEFAP